MTAEGTVGAPSCFLELQSILMYINVPFPLQQTIRPTSKT
jgi:hypothetical protein